MEKLIVPDSPAEYFRDLVQKAMTRQRVEAGELTEYYLVNLLCGFIRLAPNPGEEKPLNQPLALQLAWALTASGLEQRSRLRILGDFSLFVTGFFADSLSRRTVDVDYYVSMGEYAYGTLGRSDEDAFAEIFDELSRRFVAFSDVLAEVGEQSSLTKNSDILRLYEKFLRTGSRRAALKLIERGIPPNRSLKLRCH